MRRSRRLSSVGGIGSVTPVALQIIRAAATFYLRQSGEGRESLSDPARLADRWRMRFGALQNEVFEVAYLDSGSQYGDMTQLLVTNLLDGTSVSLYHRH